MRNPRKLTRIILIFTVMLISISCEKYEPYTEEMQLNIRESVPLADPFIILHDDMYYAYGTIAPSNGFKVYTSENLESWRLENDFVLYKDDVVGDKDFWAPEVYYIEELEEFIMYYSANEYVCVAVSNSPLGPFVSSHDRHLVYEPGIDGTLFIDDDGEKYLYFKRNWYPNWISVVKLDDTYTSMKDDRIINCLSESQKWEDGIIEGPFVFKKDEWYYLTYSSHAYDDPAYGVGYAVSKNPIGPWDKYDGNPILQFPSYKGGSLYGTGHSSFFYDKNGNLKIAFHAHHDYGFPNRRDLFIASIEFKSNPEGGAPILSIKNDLFCPHLITE